MCSGRVRRNLGDLAAVSNRDSESLELADELVEHRLAQIRAAMKQGHERAAAGEPDRGLTGRVASGHYADTRGAAELCFRGSRGVEDAQPLVVRESLDWRPPLLRPRREQIGPRNDLMISFQPDHDVPVDGFERQGAVRGRCARVELACLCDGAAGQFRAWDRAGKPR